MNPHWLLHGRTTRETVLLTCRDGIRLATDAYVPQAPDGTRGPAPTIVERTPYGRRDPELQAMAYFFAARGYNVVLQDTRGRGDSEGVFQHYLARPHEGEDGADLLTWIAEQPWSDGAVGTTGLSYTGANQQSLAITNHPALRCQVILDAGLNYFKRTVREEGAFVLGQLGTYALRMALSSPQAARDPLLRAALEHSRDHAADWFRRAPWRRGASPVSALPEYEDWLLFAQDSVIAGPEWDNPQMNLEPYVDRYPDIPVLLVTSWYGHHQWATFRKLELLAHHRKPKRVVVGTWLHADPYGHPDFVGAAAFGAQSSLNMNEVRLRWFDAHLRGVEAERATDTPTVTYFRLGGGSGRRDANGRLAHGGCWREADQWPPAGGRDLNWTLTSDGRLETGDDATPAGRRDLRVDLARPVPTIGSSIRNPDIIPGFVASGGQDQRELPDALDSPGSGLPLAARPDVAAFRSAPLADDVDLTGPLFVDLWLTSESAACDLSVKIVDEYPASRDWPDGFALNLADGYRRCASWTQLVAGAQNGEPTLVTVGPLHVSNRFAVGHRIRVDVANSSWPRYDRNPEALDRFTVTVHCGGATASRLRGPGVAHDLATEVATQQTEQS
ncbi:CocE/NonD family hydrolase [Jatrophihabitans cynanchi]|uniref:CocE/NonD family hydrolase n=1 Tax=Jatrophihabitans cynanchi TaxID=2944128 RepID=A0ABY7JVN1_9ACTN|nr:CocE/NonD family hydrolase [Jatrophihabitans sp. SB3-54]WAX55156.1 CocE/NonD family hydrolase [Jatrophihabitans sp. SB3-54]